MFLTSSLPSLQLPLYRNSLKLVTTWKHSISDTLTRTSHSRPTSSHLSSSLTHNSHSQLHVSLTFRAPQASVLCSLESSGNSIASSIFSLIVIPKIFYEHPQWDRQYRSWQNSMRGPLHCMTPEGTFHLECCARQWQCLVVLRETNEIPTLIVLSGLQEKYKHNK